MDLYQFSIERKEKQKRHAKQNAHTIVKTARHLQERKKAPKFYSLTAKEIPRNKKGQFTRSL